ncbi:2,3,4,5-tetrahydropyridine-2,6-dicarboxylate N-acetyltransferase [compost metagenome]
MERVDPATFELLDDLQIDPTAWIAPNATVIGAVTMGPRSSVYYQAVVRGDIAPIRIGADTNVQDGCILHVGSEDPCILGDRVSLGHGAIVHGATIEDDCLIGMRATILNGAVIGRGSVVGAGAVVPEKMIVPPNSLVVGIPAKVLKPVPEGLSRIVGITAENYAVYSEAHRKLNARG